MGDGYGLKPVLWDVWLARAPALCRGVGGANNIKLSAYFYCVSSFNRGKSFALSFLKVPFPKFSFALYNDAWAALSSCESLFLMLRHFYVKKPLKINVLFIGIGQDSPKPPIFFKPPLPANGFLCNNPNNAHAQIFDACADGV